MDLFSSIERLNFDDKVGSISNYNYWDQSARPLAGLMRRYAEGWARNFLMDSEFITKFRSKRDGHHEAALFELLTNQALINAGLAIEKLARSSDKTPDFQVNTEHSGDLVYIECTLSADSYDSSSDKARKDEILEVIEGMHYFPYFINVEFISISNRSISKAKLRSKFDEMKAVCDGYSSEDLREIKFDFENNDWHLKLSMFRKNAKRSPPHPYTRYTAL